MRTRALALFLVAACGTIGDPTTESTNLASTEMGPFRALEATEVKGTAPFVVDDKVAQYTDPATFDFGVLYVVTKGKIARTSASDGRTFAAPAIVLAPDQTWEGPFLSGPFAVRHDSEIWLYYAGDAGIGVARSPDGVTFTKAGPILPGAKSPSVFTLPDGRIRMMYNNGASIDEAESTDGLAWHPIGPVLGPNSDVSAFDFASVGDPCVAPRMTAGDRYQVRVLYTGTDPTHTTQIGSARYGTDGPLERNPVAAFTAGKAPAYAPPFLYVTEANVTYGAVAAAVEGTVLPKP